MRRALLIGVALVASLAASPAWSYWHGTGGGGTGSGVVVTMPAGTQPAGSVSAQSVTVTWTQSLLLGSMLGTYTYGGYSLKRYAQGSSASVTPNASCAATITGATATLQCVESSVPYGQWQYTVTPQLSTLTGAEGAKSAAVTVACSAPTLNTVTPQNPAAGVAIGDIVVNWGAVTGATGYNLYRRTSAGSYNFSSPVNGVSPLTATTYTDVASNLNAGVTYDYVVRAVAATPAVESANSNEIGATPIVRPSAPSGTPTATAVAGAQINVSWSSVSGVAGYNVYRRTSAGSYNFATPLNGASVFVGTTYSDATASNGATYLYTIRAVITGLGGAQVESTSSTESNSATADGTSPAVPTALTGGNLTVGAPGCAVATGTSFVNSAGKTSVPVSTTIATPESGETVVFTATTSGSTPVTTTVAASSTTVATNLDLSSLLDGTVTLTAQTKDVAGNLSATRSPTNTIVKDVVPAALSSVTYVDNALLQADAIAGTSECGALITVTETTGPHVGTVFTTISPGSTFSRTVETLTLVLGAYAYNVTATDIAGNVSSATAISGNDQL
jgi:hypothetical protein